MTLDDETEIYLVCVLNEDGDAIEKMFQCDTKEDRDKYIKAFHNIKALFIPPPAAAKTIMEALSMQRKVLSTDTYQLH